MQIASILGVDLLAICKYLVYTRYESIRKGVHMATDTKQIRMDSETHALLKKLAARSGRTMMGQIRHVVVEHAYSEHIKRQGLR